MLVGMQSAKRKIQALTAEVEALYRAIQVLPPLDKLTGPCHEELQEARLLQMRDSFRFVLRSKRGCLNMEKVGCSALKLRARMRAAFEAAIGSLLDFNTDLRRGEKCVSLRHDRAAAGPSGAKAARGRSIRKKP